MAALSKHRRRIPRSPATTPPRHTNYYHPEEGIKLLGPISPPNGSRETFPMAVDRDAGREQRRGAPSRGDGGGMGTVEQRGGAPSGGH